MAYTKTIWLNNDPSTPLDAVHLNNIEDGIEAVHTVADNNEIDISNINTTLGTHETRLDDLDGASGDITRIDNDISALEVADINLEKYNSWRNIASDPSGPVPADNVDNIFISWASPVTVTLPAVPTYSDRIRICDAGCDFSTNNLTVAHNGNNIMGTANDYTFSYQNGSIELSWSGSVYGWVVTRAV